MRRVYQAQWSSPVASNPGPNKSATSRSAGNNGGHTTEVAQSDHAGDDLEHEVVLEPCNRREPMTTS